MKYPLILISGLLSNDSMWQHQVSHLHDVADVQVFNPTQDSSEKMVDAILKAAPPIFALAGHSMGGWLCLDILRVAPSRVSKVCLLNTSARDDSSEKRVKRQEMIDRCKEGDFKKVVTQLADFFTLGSLMKEEVEKMFLDVGSETFINQEIAMMHRNSCEPILQEIDCPTLVIHAAQDKNFSLEEHLELVNKIPNAKLAIIEDSGHMSPLEMPQAVTTLLRLWLTYF